MSETKIEFDSVQETPEYTNDDWSEALSLVTRAKADIALYSQQVTVIKRHLMPDADLSVVADEAKKHIIKTRGLRSYPTSSYPDRTEDQVSSNRIYDSVRKQPAAFLAKGAAVTCWVTGKVYGKAIDILDCADEYDGKYDVNDTITEYLSRVKSRNAKAKRRELEDQDRRDKEDCAELVRERQAEIDRAVAKALEEQAAK